MRNFRYIALLMCIQWMTVDSFVLKDAAKVRFNRRRADASSSRITQSSNIIVRTYLHNKTHWTEGLVCHNGIMYESVGMWGHSQVFGTQMTTLGGPPAMESPTLPSTHFGESIAVNSKTGLLYQLTYRNGDVYVYEAESLRLIATQKLVKAAPVPRFAQESETLQDFLTAEANILSPNSGEGDAVEAWGLAYDPIADSMIVSDGTDTLYRFSADLTSLQSSFRVTPRLPSSQIICPNSGTIDKLQLNELEYVPASSLTNAPCKMGSTTEACAGSEIWAAVFGCSSVLRLDACTGHAIGWIQLPPSGKAAGSLMPLQAIGELRDVGDLNGIALCGSDIYLTGKLWVTMFAVPTAELVALTVCL